MSPGEVSHVCNHSTWEMQARELLKSETSPMCMQARQGCSARTYFTNVSRLKFFFSHILFFKVPRPSCHLFCVQESNVKQSVLV